MLTSDEVLKGLKPQKMLADIISTVTLQFGFGGNIQNLQNGWKWTMTFIFGRRWIWGPCWGYKPARIANSCKNVRGLWPASFPILIEMATFLICKTKSHYPWSRHMLCKGVHLILSTVNCVSNLWHIVCLTQPYSYDSDNSRSLFLSWLTGHGQNCLAFYR